MGPRLGVHVHRDPRSSRKSWLTFLLFDRWLSCETPHFLLIGVPIHHHPALLPMPPYVCALSFPTAKEYVWLCVRASSYVSWLPCTKEGRKECWDKFRDRSNGDAVSMLLAFAFRLSIQTPLSRTPCFLPVRASFLFVLFAFFLSFVVSAFCLSSNSFLLPSDEDSYPPF